MDLLILGISAILIILIIGFIYYKYTQAQTERNNLNGKYMSILKESNNLRDNFEKLQEKIMYGELINDQTELKNKYANQENNQCNVENQYNVEKEYNIENQNNVNVNDEINDDNELRKMINDDLDVLFPDDLDDDIFINLEKEKQKPLENEKTLEKIKLEDDVNTENKIKIKFKKNI